MSAKAVEASSPLTSDAFSVNQMLDLFFVWGDRFELSNLCSQPVSDCAFGIFEVSQAIVRVESESLIVERNVPAGDLLVAAIWRNELHQNTFAARHQRFAPLMVYTRGGVFENELRPPWGTGATTVPSVFQESKFRFQQGQNVAIVVSHVRRPPLVVEVQARLESKTGPPLSRDALAEKSGPYGSSLKDLRRGRAKTNLLLYDLIVRTGQDAPQTT